MKKLLTLGTAILLGGCFNMHVDLDIGPDGTGKSKVVISGLADNEMAFEGIADSLGEEADTVIREEKGDTVIYTIIDEDVDFTEGDEALVSKKGDHWVFEWKEEASGEEDETMESAFEGYTFNLEVKLPGKVLKHNADKVSGNTLTWEMPMYEFQTKGIDAKAEYEAGGGGLNLGLIGGIICCLLIIGIIVVVVILIVAKKKKANEDTSA